MLNLRKYTRILFKDSGSIISKGKKFNGKLVNIGESGIEVIEYTHASYISMKFAILNEPNQGHSLHILNKLASLTTTKNKIERNITFIAAELSGLTGAFR